MKWLPQNTRFHIHFLPEHTPVGFWKVPPQPQSMLLTGDHFEYASNEVYWKTWQWQERVAVWTAPPLPPPPQKKTYLDLNLKSIASSEIWRMFSYSFDWPGCVCGVVRNIKVVMADNTVSSFELSFYKR